MKWFKNLKISVKLISTFLVIALIAGGVGVFGIISLNNANAESAKIFEDCGNSQGYLGYIMNDFSTQRVNFRDIIMFSDSEKTKTYTNNIGKLSDDLLNNLAKYKQTCTTEQSLADYTALESALNIYFTVKDSIVQAAQGGDYKKTNDILRAASSLKSVTDAQSAVDKAVTDNIQAGTEALASEKTNTNTITLLLIAVAVAAAAIAVLLGLFLTRIIAKPLKNLAKAANMLAAGDTKVQKTSFSQKDEVGGVFDSMRGILDAVKKLTADIEMITESARKGDLSVRADASRHQGDYGSIIQGVNDTLDAVIHPIKEAMGVITAMSAGNLEESVKGDYKGDFLSFKNALNSTVDQLKRIIGEISYTLGEMSKGNLCVEITSEYQGDFAAIKEAINGIIDSLNSTMLDINTSADQISAGAHQVSDGAQETSQGATEQASSIEELTASITQIAQQTKQNAMSANDANQLTVSAVSDAARGNDQMKSMQQSMGEINEASQSIGKIIRAIDDIAFQTNILALNAAVEAARAGAHGKGFAVVAEEVRNLAVRSASAAKETADLIDSSIRKTAAGTKIADDTAQALLSIVEGVDKAAKLVSEIARASSEQAGAIAQVNSGIEQMSQVVQTNSATAEEGAASAEELSSQAEMLRNMVGRFNLKTREEQPQAHEEPVREMKKREAAEKPKVPLIRISDSDFGKY